MIRFVDPLQHEIAEERAEALGRTGRRLQQAVERLRMHELCSHDAAKAEALRETLLWDLAERVEALIVQREACGLRDPRYVLKFYDVPREVVARVGAKRPRS
jgi:hypothetical protein